jgi:endo-1,4-beta-xylanase
MHLSSASFLGFGAVCGAAVALVSIASFAQAAPERTIASSVEIVRDGKALAYIVLRPGAHPMEKEAADDLRWAVGQATGAMLEQYESEQAGDARIAIGISSVAPDAVALSKVTRAPNLPYDGATIEALTRAIVIRGQTPAGTANAVATILMDDIGARTYYPHPLFTIVPRKTSLSISARNLRPAFAYRLWSGMTGPDGAAYSRRNRLTDGRVPIPHWGLGHNLATIISVAQYGKDHPEYFAFRDGKRMVRGSDPGDTPQPCFANPDVLRLSIEAARKFFDQNPKKDAFSLCVNDNPWYCECPTCSALDKPYRDIPVGRQYSESYFDYVSKVAEAVAQSHPGRFVGVYAYWNVEQPPRNRKKLPDNVVVALTQDILQDYDPAYRDKDRALLRTWAGYAKNLSTYVYYGLGWFTPRTSPRLVADDLRFAAANGVGSIYCEAYPFWAWCGPMDYVASRLQWDVNADVDKILDEFHRDCFGEAAKEMRAYHDACERYWTRPRPGRWFEGLENLAPEEAMADPSLLKEAAGHIENALARTKDADVRERILWIKKGFELTMAVQGAFEAKKDAAARPDAAERLSAAAERVKAAHAQLVNDPSYKHTYYDSSGRFDRKWQGWLDASLKAVRGKTATSAPAATQPAKPSKTLRVLANRAHLLMGAATDPGFLKDTRYVSTLTREFNFVTSENVMKWGPVHPEPDKWNFGPADQIVDLALKHNMKMKGHCLVWHEALPKWVNAEMPADQLREAMRKHIRTLVGRYKGKVYAWDVLNEAVADKEGLRKTLFLDKLGEGYIAEAFRLAHEADPNVMLNYNDFGGEGLGGKSDRIYDLVKKLKAEGVPIHGIGLQMHISAAGYPKPEDIAANVRRLAALGLKVNISEMDVRIKDLPGDLPARLLVQQKVYHDVIAACFEEKSFIAVTFWGFTDAHTWVDSFFGPDDPLLFDEQYRPKPAYEGVYEALLEKAADQR